MVIKNSNMATPESWSKLRETRLRLKVCEGIDIDWTLYPKVLEEVKDYSYTANFMNACRDVNRLGNH